MATTGSLSEQAFKDAANLLGVEVAVIKAVDAVESNGNGFLSTGEPIILFESHVFWKELKKRGVDPTKHTKGNEDILYPVWGTKPYGKPYEQHARLQRAAEINRDAALSSASWGRFQIMGYNYKLAGFKNLQGFINAMYKDEGEHLTAFVNYIKNTGLEDELRNHDWGGFARQFNGALYWKNKYDLRLKKAYQNFAT